MNKQFEASRPVVRAMPWDGAHMSRELLLNREWLVTNGLGGYASGTVSGAVTRRYHGLLIAALPAPLGRIVMWSHVSEFLRFTDDDVVSLGVEERAGGQLDLKSADYLTEFRLEDGLPVWTYHVREVVVEKRVLLPHLQNTVHVSYQVISRGVPPRLELRPAFHFRHHEAPVDADLAAPYKLTAIDGRYEIAAARRKLPPLRMQLHGRESAFTIAPSKIPQVVYRIEQQRGYAYEGELWSPGFFRVDLTERSTATLVGSTEPWDSRTRTARASPSRRHPQSAPKFSGGVGFRGRPVCDHTRGTIRRGGARARRGRRSAHGHRGVSLVHRLGTRHDDQSGRSDFDYRALSRSGLYPSHIRALRPRRLNPQYVSRWREGREIQHRRRNALVLSRA